MSGKIKIAPERIIFCHNKQLIHADVLIDDKPGNHGNAQTHGLLYPAPHNEKDRQSGGSSYVAVEPWTRISDWLVDGII